MPRLTTAEYMAYLARGKQPVNQSGGGVEKESELHADILAECRRRGWIAIHSRMDAPSTLLLGAPDFVIMAEGGKTYYIEAKAKAGKLSEAQRAVYAWAAKLAHTIHVVRSMDEFRGVITQ